VLQLPAAPGNLNWPRIGQEKLQKSADLTIRRQLQNVHRDVERVAIKTVRIPLFKGIKMDALILMDIDQVAVMFHGKPRTIRHWVQHGRFPEPVRTGKKPLWIHAELEAHLHTTKQGKPAMSKAEPRAKGVRAAQNSAELQTMLAALRAQQMQKPARYPRS